MRDDTRHSATHRLVTLGAGLAVAFGLLIVAGHMVNVLVLGERSFELSARSEGNVFTWMSVSAAFGAAVVAAVHAVALSRYRRRMAAMAGVFAYSSADDLLVIHERVGQSLFTDALGLSKELSSRLELLMLGPLLLVGFVAAWSVSRAIAGRVGTALRAGLLVLGGAFAIEIVLGSTRMLLGGPLAWVDELRVSTEEGMELAGWTLTAAALAAVLCAGLLDAGRRAAAPDLPVAPPAAAPSRRAS